VLLGKLCLAFGIIVQFETSGFMESKDVGGTIYGV
jgi:hypothetical protein